jgi:hypothetical protein
MRLDDEHQKLGFYTTVFVEAVALRDAERKAIDALRNDARLVNNVMNSKSDSPMIFAEEIEELESFPDLDSPIIGFSFFPHEERGEPERG